MNTLEKLIPIIKRNLRKFHKPGVLCVRPGYCHKKHWPTKKPAIVVVLDNSARVPKLPAAVGGVTVEARPATDLEQFSYDHPERYSRLAEHRAELRGTSLLPEFDPETDSVASPITSRVASARRRKIPLNYVDSVPDVPLDPVAGTISIKCCVSPDAGWPTLQEFVSNTKTKLKVSMYDFTSKHILDLFESALGDKEVQLTLDDPPANPHEDQLDPETVESLQNSLSRFGSAWALVRSSPEADAWLFPTAYHIKVMVRDGNAVWISSGNLNNSNQPEIDPFGDPQPTDQETAKASDRDWHVVINSPELAQTLEAYLDSDFQFATLHAAHLSPALKQPKPALKRSSMIGDFTFVAPRDFNETMTITPLLTPDPGVYQQAMLELINSVTKSLYIQLQYIHPTSDATLSKFTDLIDAVAEKINAGLDVKIILSEFQRLRGGLDALQAAGVNLDNVKIQNNVHNKGFVIDHKKVVVSSMNWSGEGVLSNRDAGVIIDNANVAAYYEKIFLEDWNKHSEQGF
jgi:phosphatidylserine/phosphatidylglycerophosphate/cardiolipin synthase-like enzyme